MGPQQPTEQARRLLDAMKKFANASEQLVQQEVDLGKVIGTSSPPTPDALAIAAGRAQLLALNQLVFEIGHTLIDHLSDVADGRLEGVTDD